MSAVTIGRRARNDAVAARACALLPPDEQPPEPLRAQDVPTRALLFGAIEASETGRVADVAARLEQVN